MIFLRKYFFSFSRWILSVKTSWFTEEIQVTKMKSIGWFAEGKRISITRVTESYLLACPPSPQISTFVIVSEFPVILYSLSIRDSGISQSPTMRITVFCPQRRLLKFHVARKKLQYREFYSLQLLAIFRWSKDFRGGKGKGKLIKIDISRKLETRDTLNSFQTCSSTSTIRYNKEKNLYVEIDNFSNFSIDSRKIRILSIEEKVHPIS